VQWDLFLSIFMASPDGRLPSKGLIEHSCRKEHFLGLALFALLGLFVSGCMRPPNENLLGVRNNCHVRVSVSVTYWFKTDRRNVKETMTETGIEPGHIRDVSMWTEGSAYQILVQATGGSSARGKWMAQDIPRTLKGIAGVSSKLYEDDGGDALLDVYPTKLELKADHPIGTKLLVLSALGIIMLLAVAAALILWIYIRMRTRGSGLRNQY